MRNYWIRIFIGAFAVFAIGMTGVTLVRSGLAKVHNVVDSDGPIDLPLRFIPFFLGGERLGRLDRLVVRRDTPRRVESVELEIELTDSLVAQGLSECRLAANFESRPGEPGINVRTARESRSAFSCLAGDSIPPEFVEFGEAVFQPGEVRVPLFLQQDLVDELRSGLGAGPDAGLTPEEVDSIAAQAKRGVDSALSEAGLQAGTAGETPRRFRDSLRAAALARADSALEGVRMADTAPSR